MGSGAARSPQSRVAGNRDLSGLRTSVRNGDGRRRAVRCAIHMLDTSGHVASWNAGAQRIKGYAPEEIIGRHFSDFYTEADRAAGLPRIGLETATQNGRWEHDFSSAARVAWTVLW